jgi:hypothetical protein
MFQRGNLAPVQCNMHRVNLVDKLRMDTLKAA